MLPTWLMQSSKVIEKMSSELIKFGAPCWQTAEFENLRIWFKYELSSNACESVFMCLLKVHCYAKCFSLTCGRLTFSCAVISSSMNFMVYTSWMTCCINTSFLYVLTLQQLRLHGNSFIDWFQQKCHTEFDWGL